MDGGEEKGLEEIKPYTDKTIKEKSIFMTDEKGDLQCNQKSQRDSWLARTVSRQHYSIEGNTIVLARSVCLFLNKSLSTFCWSGLLQAQISALHLHGHVSPFTKRSAPQSFGFSDAISRHRTCTPKIARDKEPPRREMQCHVASSSHSQSSN